MASFKRNIIDTIIRQVASLVVGLFGLAIISRILGAEGQGEYTILILVPVLLYNLLNLGLVPGTIYWVGKKKFPIGDIHRTNGILSLLLSCLGICLSICIYITCRNSVFAGVHWMDFLLAIASLPFLFANYFFYSILQGREEFQLYNRLIFINQCLLMGLVLFSIVALDLGVTGAAGSFTAAQILTWIQCRHLAKRNKTDYQGGEFSQTFVRNGIGYGISLYACNILAFVNYRADLLLISYFMDIESVGIYAIAVAVAEKLWIVPSAVSNVLFAKVANTDPSAYRGAITEVSTRATILLTLVLTLILLPTARYIIPWVFGDEFSASVIPLAFLLPGVVLASAAKTISSDFSGRGHAKINAYVSVSTVVINLVLNVWLIPAYGLAGAAIATSCSYTSNALVKSMIYSRINGVTMWRLLVIQREDFKYLRGNRMKQSA